MFLCRIHRCKLLNDTERRVRTNTELEVEITNIVKIYSDLRSLYYSERLQCITRLSVISVGLL